MNSNKFTKCLRMKHGDLAKVLRFSNSDYKGLNDMPGPTPLPVIGTSWIYSFFGPYNKKTSLTSTREDLLLKYGSIYKEVLSGTNVVSLHTPEHILKLLLNQGKHPMRTVNEATIQFRKSRPDLFKSIGLTDTNGEDWYDIRMKVAPSLLRGGMWFGFTEVLSGIADEFVKTVKQEGKGDVDIRPIIHRFGLEAIILATLGLKLGALEKHPSNETKEMIVLSKEMFDLFATLSMSRPWYKLWRTPNYRKYCRCEEANFRLASVYIQQIMERIERGETLTSGEHTPIICRYLADPNFEVKDIITSIMDLIVSGISTVSYFLSMFLHRIGQEQEIQNIIFKEMDSNNLKGDAVIDDKTFKNLPYLEATLKEGFRLTTIIPGIFRILDKPIAMDEYLIPASTPIIAQTRAACLSETYFSSPLEFIPDRWLKEKSSNQEIAKLQEEAKKNRMIVLPFGFGARMCAGRKLAESELKVLVAKILLNFRIESEGTVELENRFIIGPSAPIKIKFQEK